LAQKIYGYVLQYGDWTDETLSVAVIIEAALAEREAQVRAEEREKVAGLVEAGQQVVNRWDSPNWKWDDEHTGDKIHRLRKAIATYNDNRNG